MASGTGTNVGLLCALVATVMGPGLAAGANETQTIYGFTGAAPGERFGAAVARAGDADGDGIPDLLVAAPRANGAPGPGAGRVVLLAGATGIPLLEVEGREAWARFGASVAGVGDFDGDGHDDFVAGAPFGGASSAGVVTVFSGRDGTEKMTFAGAVAGDEFGHAVASIGDADGDGIVDLLVGSPSQDAGGLAAGRVTVHAGASGAVLLSIEGSAFDRLGHAVARAGDVDQDGFDDLVAGAPLADDGAFNGGAAYVLSSRTGTTLLAFAGGGVADQLGYSVAGLGDVDGDARPDVALGAPAADPNGIDSGRAYVHSGAGGTLLFTVDGDGAGDSLGFVSEVGDVDDDGLADVAIGAPSQDGGGQVDGGQVDGGQVDGGQVDGGRAAGAVRVVSGATGALVVAADGPAEMAWFGLALAGVGDIDGNGTQDLLIGGPGHDDAIEVPGFARLIDGGGPRPLAASNHVASLADGGGTIEFQLTAGPEHAGSVWFLLGSTGGTSPGLQLGGPVLPLATPDPYFLHSLSHPNAPPLSPSLGTLSEAGGATAGFTLPRGLPGGWAGLTLHHAYLVLNGPTHPVFASNAVPLTLVP